MRNVFTSYTHKINKMRSCEIFRLMPDTLSDARLQTHSFKFQSVQRVCVCLGRTGAAITPSVLKHHNSALSSPNAAGAFHRSPRKVPQPNGKHGQNPNARGTAVHFKRAFMSKEHFLKCRAICEGL